MKYEFISKHCSEYGVLKMVRVLNVSRSGYYYHYSNPVTKRQLEDNEIAEDIRFILNKGRHVYGTPKIKEELLKKDKRVSRARIKRIMEAYNITSKKAHPFVVTTDSNHNKKASPNLLNRTFTVNVPDSVWVSDISYIHTAEGFLYLCIVMDLFSRKIVGWSIADHMRTSMVLEAFDSAIKSRRPSPGLIFHSDQGSQYASDEFRKVLSDYGVFQSMSRKGNCWDNSPAESFFSLLKKEEVYLNYYESMEYGKDCIFEYIEVFYNRQRSHSFIGYVSPDEFELAYVA